MTVRISHVLLVLRRYTGSKGRGALTRNTCHTWQHMHRHLTPSVICVTAVHHVFNLCLLYYIICTVKVKNTCFCFHKKLNNKHVSSNMWSWKLFFFFFWDNGVIVKLEFYVNIICQMYHNVNMHSTWIGKAINSVPETFWLLHWWC